MSWPATDAMAWANLLDAIGCAQQLRHSKQPLNDIDNAIRHDLQALHVTSTLGNAFTLPFDEDRQVPAERNESARQHVVLGYLDRVGSSLRRRRFSYSSVSPCTCRLAVAICSNVQTCSLTGGAGSR